MLKNILKSVTLKGQREINEIVVNDKKILATSPDQSIAIRLTAKKSILDTKEIIGLQKLNSLKKYLDLLPKVKIELKDNRLMLSEGKKKVNVLLKSPEYINSKVEEKNFNNIIKILEGVSSIKVDLKNLRNIENYLIATESTFFDLELKGKDLIVSILEENKDNIIDTIELIEGSGEAKVRMSNSFVEAIQGLEGEVELVLKNNSPILIKQETEDFKIEILVAEVS